MLCALESEVQRQHAPEGGGLQPPGGLRQPVVISSRQRRGEERFLREEPVGVCVCCLGPLPCKALFPNSFISFCKIRAVRADRNRKVVRGRPRTHSEGLSSTLRERIHSRWKMKLSVSSVSCKTPERKTLRVCVCRATWPQWPVREFQKI